MPLSPKNILGTALEQGRKVVDAGVGRLRRDEGEEAAPAETPAAPRAGGAKTGGATPGTTRTARAASASRGRAAGSTARKPAASSTPAETGAKTTPRDKPGATPRTSASKAAAQSGSEVSEAADS